MSAARTAPYGSWKSPISSDLVVSATVRLGGVLLDGNDVYWTELRPAEDGRNLVVRRAADGRTTDLTPRPMNARTRVHEYGGGAFYVADGTVYFSNFADGRLYVQSGDNDPCPLTPETAMRYADFVLDRAHERLVGVREDHSASDQEAVNTIVGIRLDGGDTGDVLVAGNDFYSNPRLSPDGRRLCWLTWNHPNMPWDGTELFVADVQADGSLGKATLVAGGKEESIFQPEWSPDGALYFISDRSGWWNLYRWQNGQAQPLQPMEAEFAGPSWAFAASTYAFADAQTLVCTYEQEGTGHLAELDVRSGAFRPLDLPYTEYDEVRAEPGRCVCIAGSPTEARAIIQIDLASGAVDVLRRSSTATVDPSYLSTPQPIEFPTEHGQTAHALYYPPRNPDFEAPAGDLPPLLVKSHGGPTSAASSVLSLGTQYWTSRGFAVLDVNYGGSTGYGRAYRQRLDGQWGVVDVDDCVNGARYLVQQGLVDGNRLAITGGSAGGYTTLCALTFRDTFTAGASHFGLSELEVFVHDTHKFESRYLERLIGPYPERRDLYRERSPINYTDQLSSPVILFQGLEDKIVPPNQAELMVEALRKKGLPVAYLTFEGEQHGFRKAENIKRSLDAEFYFYSRVFGFTPADAIEPVPIENLPA